jgi:signal-transduction protein with cAMP-binding, CBS, and nucleotidyltransferase domain
MKHESKPNLADYQELIRKFFERFTLVESKDLYQLIPYLEIREFAKKEIILHEGEVERYLNLVAKGMLRKYIVAGKKETTLQLATEGHLIQSETSFHTQVASEVIIESIEPSILICISAENTLKAFATMENAEQITRLLIAYMYLKKDARLVNQLKLSTRQRFLKYIDEHPHMLQRVPQRILASYLNIKPETFSRLKHLVVKRSSKVSPKD